MTRSAPGAARTSRAAGAPGAASLAGAGALVAAVLLAATVGRAVADDVVTYQAEGVAAADQADARTRALDVAFAAAVTEAVADLAGSAARAQADAVDREIIRRARRFVASFSVTDQRTAGGQVVLEVAIKVDRDKLRARLGELGVTLAAVATAPTPPPVTRRRATVLMRVTGLGRPLSSFGAAATDDVPGLPAVGQALDRAGFAVVAASAAGPPPDDAGGLPLDDAGARALAGDARADVAVVVGIVVGDAGPIRGVGAWAAPATAVVRVLDVGSGAVMTEATLASGAVGKPDRERLPVAAAEAAAGAVIAAGLGLAPVAGAPIVDAPPIAAAHGVTVRIRGATPWPAVAAIRARLASAPGDPKVTFAGVTRGQVALEVDGLSAARIAGHLRTADGLDAAITVTDDAVEIVARGAP